MRARLFISIFRLLLLPLGLFFVVGGAEKSFAEDRPTPEVAPAPPATKEAPKKGELKRELPRFGLWVEAEGKNRPYSSLEDYQTFLKFSGSEKFTDLYCQIYRRGRSWFPSVVADDQPYRDSLKAGFDPLGDTIRVARSRGQRVHAWFNVLRIAENFDAPLLLTIGADAVLVDSEGNSLVDYDDRGRPPGRLGKYVKLGTPGIWLDPSSDELRAYLLETIRDVVHHYPELDGIHLDMIRFPLMLRYRNSSSFRRRVDFAYSQTALRKYYAYRGVATSPIEFWRGKKTKLTQGDDWANWRRSQVSLMVYEVRELLKEIAPHMELSAAVMATPTQAFSHAFQDWQSWLRGGLLDTVVLMAYTRDSQLVFRNSKQAVQAGSIDRVITGLGAWMMLNDQKRLVHQANLAFEAGAGGVTLFSYSNLLSPKGKELLRYFAKNADLDRDLGVGP